MLKTRAFLNSCYILRANRVGEYQMESSTWKFYGDTLWVKPNGEIEDSLGEKEELLLGELDQGYLEEIRRSWAFR
jgi:predicted amidohydrolase